MNKFLWFKKLGAILSVGLILFGIVMEFSFIFAEGFINGLGFLLFSIPGFICLFFIWIFQKIKFNEEKKGYDLYINALKGTFFVNTSYGNAKYNKDTFNINEIVNYRLVSNDEILISSGIGEAIVGGILFGGSGAIAGSYLGKRPKVRKKCILYIETNNIFYAGITIPVDEETGFKICKIFEVFLSKNKK